MPYLSIHTQVETAPETVERLIADASQTVAEQLGKPERVVMVAFDTPRAILFGGQPGPAAWLDLRSIGISEAQATALAAVLTGPVESALGVPRDRVFINFADVPRSMWGWDGRTL